MDTINKMLLKMAAKASLQRFESNGKAAAGTMMEFYPLRLVGSEIGSQVGSIAFRHYALKMLMCIHSMRQLQSHLQKSGIDPAWKGAKPFEELLGSDSGKMYFAIAEKLESLLREVEKSADALIAASQAKEAGEQVGTNAPGGGA